MPKIKKNDTVKVLAGKDKGKTGKVLKIFPDSNSAIVQGVNFVKRHTRRTRQDDQGGIVEKESRINLSNLSVICKGCNAPVRVGNDVLNDGSKVRYCKNCKEVF